MLSVTALLVTLVPASASAAAFDHYVACGVSQNAKPAHLCQKQRKKGAFFKSNNATVFYTVCVKFPTGKNLCAPKQEAVQGTLYVNKITSNIPGKHTRQLVRRGQESRQLRLHGSRLAWRSIGFDTATEDTAVCATRDGEVLHESLLGLSADGSPGHTTRLLEEVERAADAAGGWERVEAIAVGVGPGSFTGLRVGIASARGARRLARACR